MLVGDHCFMFLVVMIVLAVDAVALTLYWRSKP